MKKFFIICAVILGVLSVSSCGVSVGTYLTNSDTKTVLSENNFNVVGTAQGQSEATYVFGIGGLSKKALEANAVNNMFEDAHLTGAQTITNVRTHVSYKSILCYQKVVITATGTVIEFK